VYASVSSNAEGPGYKGLGAGKSEPGLLQRLEGSKPTATIPTKQQFLNPTGTYYGVSTQKAPYDSQELDQVVSDSGGIHPTMAQYFLSWNQPFNPASISAAYSHGTIPVLTWEPWGGGQQNADNGGVAKSNIDQPAYKLSNIIAGKFDSYITTTAKSIAGAQWPIVIRLAQEMNGVWYPWSEQVNGNKPGEFVQAWRHVHDLFTQAGATNVIWVWSPNIIRPVLHTRLAPLYPGDAYVDWIGLTGYGVKETGPAATFGPTLQELQSVAKKPIMLMETAAQRDSDQIGWVNAFFPWLKANPQVIGFIWMEKDRSTGARADWRFTSSPALQQAFQAGLATLKFTDGTAGALAPQASPSASPGGLSSPTSTP
jgi:hypothetical protein